MDLQYQFELTFKNISFIRLQTKPILITVALLKADQEGKQISPCLQTEEIALPAYRKQHLLTSIPSFEFKTTKQAGHKNFYIKYQLKGTNDPPAMIEIGTPQMITEFQEQKRQVFSQKYEAKNLELEYQIKVAIQQKPVQFRVNLTQIKSEIQQEEKASDKSKIRNNMTRSRPPLLEIAKVYNDSNSEISKANTLTPLPYRQKTDYKDIMASPYLTEDKDSIQDKSAAGLTLGKKISSIPLSEIEKVNDLLKSHHRPTDHKQQSHSMSYKLKIVFIMIIIGIVSLAYDTINDRFTTNPRKNGHKKSHKNHKAKAKAHKSGH